MEPDKQDEWCWFEIEKLPNNIYSPSKKFIEAYLDRSITQIDIKKADKTSKYMRDLFTFYGIPSPQRKDKTNTNLLEQKIVNSFGSDEFFINKAIGWSLRNYSRTNLVWVINFIIKYRTLMNKLSIKEASKYL